MSTPPQQTSRSNLIESRQGTDRRKQADRRHQSGRRETDQQHPEQSFQPDSGNNAQAEEQSGNNTYNRRTILTSRPAVHALSEDEIRFLLDDECM